MGAGRGLNHSEKRVLPAVNSEKETPMFKQIVSGAALGILALGPALAESTTTPSATTQNSSSSTFLQQQTANEWRASKLIGATVRGPDNQNIGTISDVLLDPNGSVQAIVVGVGGFLGLGEKDVAMPFKDLTVARSSSGNSIDHVSVAYTKAQLNSAPNFKYLGSNR
jgi:sporulation protein YlmC with PRC-barrel domain